MLVLPGQAVTRAKRAASVHSRNAMELLWPVEAGSVPRGHRAFYGSLCRVKRVAVCRLLRSGGVYAVQVSPQRLSGALCLAAVAMGCSYEVPDIVGPDGAAGQDGSPLPDGAIYPYEGGLDAGGVLDGPSCGQDLVCAPGPPSGWNFVTFTSDPQSICPTGYANSAILLEGPDAGPATCGCACGVPTTDTSNCQSNAAMTINLGTTSACSGSTQTIDAVAS